MKYFAGIDPGLDGGIVVISDELALVRAEVMPVEVSCTKLKNGRSRRTRHLDEHAVRDLLESYRDQLRVVTLEALTRGHPGLRGVNSAVTMGVHHGLLRGVLCGLRVPYLLTPAQRWQAAMLVGTGDTKARSVQRARELFPTLDLTPGQRTTPHDGLADAALLAFYGLHALQPPESTS